MERGKGPDAVCAEPRDTYNMAYMIHFVLGAGSLLPWNTFITAVDYFGHVYPSKHIDKVFSVAYMGSSLPVLVLMMSCCSNRYYCWKPSFRLRMNLGLIMFVLSLITPPLIDWAWLSDSDGSSQETLDAAYRVTVAAITVCGLADGLIGGSLIGSTGKLPKRYMQAVFSGTASSGVLVSILRIITKASLPKNGEGLRKSAHFYFAVSTLIMLGCIICCNIVDKLVVMQHYRQKTVPGSHISHCPDALPITQNFPSDSPKFWHVAKSIRWASLGILTIYVVTLSIFPGFITENVESNLLRDWYPILLITIYNVSDLAGKSFTAIYAIKSIGKASWACVARLLFYPLFTACLHGPRWLRHELPVLFLTAGLGLSNGYLTSVLMMLAPKSVPVTEAETAGIVMALFLGIGLVGGSVLGWFWII